MRAPAAAVWKRIADPTHWPRELGRMHCSHVAGSPDAGPGARYWLHLEVGAAEVGSLIEILEHEPRSTLSWATIEGLEQRGHWRLRDHGDGSTEVTLSVSYQAAGGLAALATDEISSLWVRRYLRDSLRTLTRRLEGTPSRGPAGGAAGLLGRGAHLFGDGVHAARTVTRARLVRPARPDRYVRALTALARWGESSAGGYAVAAALYPGDPAIIDEQGTLTFAQLQERTGCLTRALASHGIGMGAQVAVMCRNHRSVVETLVACSKLGAYTLLLDTGLAKARLTELIKGERPAAVVYDAEFAEQLAMSLRRRKGFIAWTDGGGRHGRSTLAELISEGDPAVPPAPAHEGRATDLAAPATDAPTGALRGSPSIGAAVGVLDCIPLRSRERVLVAVPLFDQLGFASFSLAALLASALVLQRRFDPEATLAAIERERISCCTTVPLMLARILELPPDVRHSYDTSSLRTVLVSGSAVAGALARSFMDEYGDVLYSLHGTSALGWVAIASPADLRRAPGTAGRPLRKTIVRVLDEDGIPLRAGRTGWIFVANEMSREPRTAEETEAFDGLMATGEKGHLDDHGRLFLEGRDEAIRGDAGNVDELARNGQVQVLKREQKHS